MKDRECVFGEVINEQVNLSTLGSIVQKEWENIVKRYKNVELDQFIVMPDHLHGIIVIHDDISDDVGAPLAGALIGDRKNIGLNHFSKNETYNLDQKSDIITIDVGATARVAPTKIMVENKKPDDVKNPTLGEIVGGFKSICVVKWLNHIKQNNLNVVGKFWQRNFYDHIVRNEKEFDRICEYIKLNPINWELNKKKPENLYM